MEDLMLNIKENYNMEIDSIEAKGNTTINDILFLKGKGKKFILKLYNVDSKNQINNSARTQKMIYKTLKIAPDVILNNKTWQQALSDDWRIEHKWQPGWKYIVK